MREILKLVLVLTLITAGSGLALSLVEKFTREPIAHQRRLQMLQALQAVLPASDNAPDQDRIELVVGTDRKGQPLKRSFYRGRMGADPSGVAFQVRAPDGYSGNIDIMVGVRPSGEVNGIQILTHAETPGLGDKIEEGWFREQFAGKGLDNADWRVKKDGGEFDQISGATISPRVVVAAVKKGLEFFRSEREKILYGQEVQR